MSVLRPSIHRLADSYRAWCVHFLSFSFSLPHPSFSSSSPNDSVCRPRSSWSSSIGRNQESLFSLSPQFLFCFSLHYVSFFPFSFFASSPFIFFHFPRQRVHFTALRIFFLSVFQFLFTRRLLQKKQVNFRRDVFICARIFIAQSPSVCLAWLWALVMITQLRVEFIMVQWMIYPRVCTPLFSSFFSTFLKCPSKSSFYFLHYMYEPRFCFSLLSMCHRYFDVNKFFPSPKYINSLNLLPAKKKNCFTNFVLFAIWCWLGEFWDTQCMVIICECCEIRSRDCSSLLVR